MKLKFLHSLLILLTSFSFLFAQDGVSNQSANVSSDQQQDYVSIEPDDIGSIVGINFDIASQDNFVLNLLLNKEFIADVKLLNYPFRLVIDVPMPYKWAVKDEMVSQIPVSYIQKIRYGSPDPSTFRVIIYLSRSLKMQSVNVIGRDTSYNLAVSLQSNTSGYPSKANTIAFSRQPSVLKKINENIIAVDNANSLKKSREVTDMVRNHLSKATYLSPSLDKKDAKTIIFIDPGHGGKDSGAISDDKAVVEKDIVLKVAQALKQELEYNSEIGVILSRKDDYYVPLKDRVLWASFYNVNLFISLHADKAENFRESSGLSVYTLSDGSSDSLTSDLVLKANTEATENTPEQERQDEAVNAILLNLSKRVRSNDSILLGKSLIHHAAKKFPILDNPMRSAGFAVLKTSGVPSVLIELGFLSNEKDVAMFKKEDYVKSVSENLSVGIQYYLWERSLISDFPSDAYKKLYKETQEVIKEPDQKKGLFSFLFSD